MKNMEGEGHVTSVFATENASDCALNLWWQCLCGASWIVFAIFEIFIGIDRAYSEHPLCPHTDKDYEHWYWYANYACFGGFVLVWLMLLWKILATSKETKKRIPLFVAFNIVSIATITTILTLGEWGGVCIDALNVASPAALWGEWLPTGPLLIFITATITQKPSLTGADWFMMGAIFSCVAAGFFIIPSNQNWGVFWLVISCLAYAPTICLPWCDDIHRHPHFADQDMKHLLERYAQQYNTAMCLTAILPLFTVDYLAAYFNVINAAQTIAIYQFLSVLAKGLFAAAVMDLHVDIVVGAERALLEERRAKAARRTFLKFIFHELWDPLNALMVGVDVMGMSAGLTSQESKCVGMMRAALHLMGDALDDLVNGNILSNSNDSIGNLYRLDMQPFSLRSIVETAFAALHGATIIKGLTLACDVAGDVPALVVGDARLITFVIMNLLSNSIIFSPFNKSVKVVMRCEGTILEVGCADKAIVSVSIEDQGIDVDRDKLSDSFTQAQGGQGQVDTSKWFGLSLSFGKRIVEMHKGTICITSQPGRGSQFKFTIPFDTVKNGRPTTEKTATHDVVGPTHDVSAEGPIATGVQAHTALCRILSRGACVGNEGTMDSQQALSTMLDDVERVKIVFINVSVADSAAATNRLRAEGIPFLIIGLSGDDAEAEGVQLLGAGADVALRCVTTASVDAVMGRLEAVGPVSPRGVRVLDGFGALGLPP